MSRMIHNSMFRAAVLGALVAITGAVSTFEVPVVPYGDLQQLTDRESPVLSMSLRHLGIVAVSGIPGYKDARLAALDAFSSCSSAGASETSLLDGSSRRTVAAMTSQRVLGALPSMPSCPTFTEAAAVLRAIVDMGSQEVIRHMDLTMASKREDSTAQSIGDLIADPRAEHLEHFHAYTPPRQAAKILQHTPGSLYNATETALQMHTDAGLLIAMTVATYTGAADGEHGDETDGGLFFQQPHGVISKVHAPSDALLFMVGEGAPIWLARTDSARGSFRAAPHAMMVPRSAGTRLWYGKMFLPRHGLGMFSTGAVDKWDLEGQAPTGCSGGRRMGSSPAECASQGKLLCWMRCMEIPDGCLDKPTCRDPSGRLYPNETNPNTPPGKMAPCPSCKPVCKELPTTEPTPYCDATNPVSMYMTGFDGDTEECLVFLFPTWVIDSRVKFAVSCAGTLLMGVLVEWVVFFRRELLSSSQYKTSLGQGHFVVWGLVYMVQLSLGYFLMLLAMTYSGWLFVMVVVGLGAGHLLFNHKAPVLESSDACCSGQSIARRSTTSMLTEEKLLANMVDDMLPRRENFDA